MGMSVTVMADDLRLLLLFVLLFHILIHDIYARYDVCMFLFEDRWLEALHCSNQLTSYEYAMVYLDCHFYVTYDIHGIYP
jgi:hypothetical protein